MNHRMTDIFRMMGNGTQLMFLVLFSFIGYLFGGILSGLTVLIIDGSEGLTSVNSYSLVSLWLSQIISTVCWLLLSSMLYLYLFQKDKIDFLKIRTLGSLKIVLLAVLLVFVIQPTVGFLGYINHLISFPDTLASLEGTFKELEEMASVLIARMISDKSVFGIIVNISIIAVMAAVIEELFFRGCLQQIIVKIVRNKHIAVWLTAIIFSAVHLQFYGFLPRILLGAMLGYLFVWTSNLWIPIIAHFVNNLTAVVLQIIYYGTPQYERIENFDINKDIWYLPFSIIISLVFACLIMKKSKREVIPI